MLTLGVKVFEPSTILMKESFLDSLLYCDSLIYALPEVRNPKSLPQSTAAKTKFIRSKLEALAKVDLAYQYEMEGHPWQDVLSDNETDFLISYMKLVSSDSHAPQVKQVHSLYIVGMFLTRALAVKLQTDTPQENFVPILTTWPGSGSFGLGDQTKPVLNIVLNKFPQIDESVDISRLIDFKKDPDTRLKLYRLKDWIMEIGKKSYTEKEIEQKIEYLLMEYTQQMDLFKLKYKLGTFESVILPTLEILENIAKLNFSKIAKTLFDLKRHNINLLEAERKAVGKEIAYIYKANETFSQKKRM